MQSIAVSGISVARATCWYVQRDNYQRMDIWNTFKHRGNHLYCPCEYGCAVKDARIRCRHGVLCYWNIQHERVCFLCFVLSHCRAASHSRLTSLNLISMQASHLNSLKFGAKVVFCDRNTNTSVLFPTFLTLWQQISSASFLAEISFRSPW